MGLWEDIYELRLSNEIPRNWRVADLRKHLHHKYKENALKTMPANTSISCDGTIKGNSVKKGSKPRAWRVGPPGSGLYSLIEDPGDESTRKTELALSTQLARSSQDERPFAGVENPPIGIQSQAVELNDSGITKINDYGGNLSGFLEAYDYQPGLTPKLDALEDSPLDQEIINEIVLWKTNRYALLNAEDIHSLNELMHLRNGEHRQGQTTLEALLATRGVDLAMASTILRFRNPKVFQIIDRHAYRAVYGRKLNPGTSNTKKVVVYFEYLDDLISLSRDRKTPFETIDRLLYEYDKNRNGKL